LVIKGVDAMSTDLSNDNDAYINDAIARGAFRDRNEALDAGVDMLRRRAQLLARIERAVVNSMMGNTSSSTRQGSGNSSSSSKTEPGARRKAHRMSDRRFRLSDQAVADLQGISGYIGERNPAASEGVLDAL
jgi:hypothetical protein